MPYEDDSMHFAYAMSVFSHLDIASSEVWLRELHRILCSGGHLLITILGVAYFHSMSFEERRQFVAGEPVIHGLEVLGENGCAAFYPESLVRQWVEGHFEIVDLIPGGASGNGHQDIYLLRKP